MSDIAPCPFCSSSDMLVIEDDGIHVNPKIIAVHCKSCGARGPTTGRRIDVESKIITRSRWNRRSLATQHHQGGEALMAEALRVLDKYADPTGYTDSNGEQMPADAVLHEGLLAKDTAAKIRSALAQQPLSVQEGWRPIETAPKPGEFHQAILAAKASFDGEYIVGEAFMLSNESLWHWCNEVSKPIESEGHYGSGIITHWMPMPAEPTVGGEQG